MKRRAFVAALSHHEYATPWAETLPSLLTKLEGEAAADAISDRFDSGL